MPAPAESSRLDYLDAARGFALLLGIVFHASLSFLPIFIGWAVQDVSTSPLVGMFVVVSHSFRMETFFLLAGFFSHLTFHRKGAGAFLRSRAIRIVLPFVVGWFALRPLIVSGWIMGAASLRGDYDVWAGLKGGWQSLATLPSGLFVGSHLWFLYYLAMITAAALLGRSVLQWARSRREGIKRRADAAVAWLSASSLGVPLLVIPTAAALWFMRHWGMDTPDMSLRPHPAVLAIYGGFFVFGWMLGRQRAAMAAFGRLAAHRWIGAAIGIAGTLLLGRLERELGHSLYALARVAHALAYALMMWSLVALTLGVFQRVCRRPRASVRYLADASYWLYLVHLPVVVWLQVAVAEVPLHWSLKLALISAATTAIALLTYDLFVRSTVIGQVLNGRRRPRVLALRSRGPAAPNVAAA